MPTAIHITDAERARAVDIEALRREGAVTALLQRLDDPSWTVRRAVVSALARLGDPAVIPLADVLRLQRDDESRIAAVVETLVASFGNVDPVVLSLADSSDPAIVCDAIQILGRRRATAAMDRLGALITHENDNVALAAIEAIGRIGGDAAIDLMVGAIQTKNFFRAFPAIDVLGRSGDPRAVAPLSALLAEPHYAMEAVRALGHAGQPQAAPALAALLLKPHDALIRVTAVALAEIDDRSTERFGPGNHVPGALGSLQRKAASRRLVRALVGADASERAAICRVLGWVGEVESVEALVELLDAEPTAAHAAAMAIARLAPDAEPLLVAALRESPSERRLLLLPLLARSRGAAADVVECLDDPDPGVRAVAADTLGKIGNDRVVPRLFAVLADADARVSQSAASAIQALGGDGTQNLALEAAHSPNPRVRRSALRILAYFGWPSALEVFLAALEDPDERIQDVAAAGLATVEDPRAVQALVAATGRPAARARAAAVRALGQTQRHPEVTRALGAALADLDPWVRYYACQAMSRLREESASAPIAAMLSDPAPQVKVAAIEALARLQGRGAVDALHLAARNPDADVRRAALLALGSVRSPTSLPVLREALESPEAATRLVALSALSEFGDHDAVDSARLALKDVDESVRAAAVGLLSARPGKEATAALVAELGNPIVYDRIVAALSSPVEGHLEGLVGSLHAASAEQAPRLISALARMGTPDAAAALEEALREPNVHVRRAVVPALAALGTPSARRQLERAARDDADGPVRELCAAVLGG